MALVIISNFANKNIGIQMYYGIYFYIFHYLCINIAITTYFSSLWININWEIMSKKRKKDSKLERIIHHEGRDSNVEISENNEQIIEAAKQLGSRAIRWCEFSSKTMQKHSLYYRQKSWHTYDTMLQEIYFNFV